MVGEVGSLDWEDGAPLRIGIASDSHGNVAVLERAFERFSSAGVDRVFFLGGRVADVDAVLARRRASREVPIPPSDSEFLRAVESALARHGKAPADPLATRVVRVASRACPEYGAGTVPRKQVDLVEGRICCLVHDKSELTRDDIANATVLFHGNSSQAKLVQIGPRTFVTPGHLRAAAPEGHPQTFAILEVGARDLVMTVFAGSGEEVRRERASLSVQGKMSVR